jgi:hypothetical protein
MPQYDPAAFHEVFATLTNLPIVGGQAVNLWAEIYGAANQSLDEHRPFLSKDADLFGERAAIEAHTIPKGWTIQYYGIPRQMAVALLTKDLAGGEQMRVEVLRSVYGLHPRDVADAALVEISPGRVYRLPSPIVLLKAKIANTHDLVKKERPQDLKHVRMLVIICAHYLRDLHASVLAGATPERTLINTLHALCEVISTRQALAVAEQHRVNLAAALPLDLPVDNLPKLAAFYANLPGPDKPRRSPKRSPRQR